MVIYHQHTQIAQKSTGKGLTGSIFWASTCRPSKCVCSHGACLLPDDAQQVLNTSPVDCISIVTGHGTCEQPAQHIKAGCQSHCSLQLTALGHFQSVRVPPRSEKQCRRPQQGATYDYLTGGSGRGRVQAGGVCATGHEQSHTPRTALKDIVCWNLFLVQRFFPKQKRGFLTNNVAG